MTEKPNKGPDLERSGDLQVRIRRVVDPRQYPTPLQRSVFSAVGDDVQLDLGHYDMPAVRDTVETMRAGKEQPEPLNFMVVGRFILTPTSATELLETAKKIVDHFKRAGKIAETDAD